MGGLPSESKVTRCTSATVAGQPTAGEHPRRPVPDHERRRGGDLAHLRPGAISRSPTAPRVVPTPAATPPLQHLRSALNAGPFSGEPRPRSILSRQRPAPGGVVVWGGPLPRSPINWIRDVDLKLGRQFRGPLRGLVRPLDACASVVAGRCAIGCECLGGFVFGGLTTTLWKSLRAAEGRSSPTAWCARTIRATAEASRGCVRRSLGIGRPAFARERREGGATCTHACYKQVA